MRLDFVIPGFSKCGTTTLCALLCEHPDVFICKMKEPNFFTHFFERGWEWYESLYKPAEPHQLCGDGSTTYTSGRCCVMARDRILETYPEIKFIFIARNPITRLESSYREMHHNGHKFGVLPPYDLGKTLDKHRNMIADTQYWARISAYRERVPDDRILVLFLEDLEADPCREVRRCFEFLGVSPEHELAQPDRRLNTADVKTYDSWIMRKLRMNPWTAELLKDPRWKRYSPEWLVRTGLRKPFRKPVRWNRLACQIVARDVLEDARQFLAFYGKPANFWDFSTVEVATAARRAA